MTKAKTRGRNNVHFPNIILYVCVCVYVQFTKVCVL